MASYDKEALINDELQGRVARPSSTTDEAAAAAAAASGMQVELAIGQEGTKDWDDAELVDAWDAAAEEWRVSGEREAGGGRRGERSELETFLGACRRQSSGSERSAASPVAWVQAGCSLVPRPAQREPRFRAPQALLPRGGWRGASGTVGSDIADTPCV